MRINNITYTPTVNFTAKKREGKNNHYVSPVRAGLTTAVIWGGFGVVFEQVSKKLTKALKSDKKSSLVLNGGCALVFGMIDGVKTAIRNKKAAE